MEDDRLQGERKSIRYLQATVELWEARFLALVDARTAEQLLWWIGGYAERTPYPWETIAGWTLSQIESQVPIEQLDERMREWLEAQRS